MGSGALCHRVDVFLEHRVADLIFQAQWNWQLLNQILEPELVRQVVQVSPPASRGADRMVWALTADGAFSVDSAYSVVTKSATCSWVASHIWLQGCPLKISFFMLRLLRSRLPLMDMLRRFGVQGPSRCRCCFEPGEEGIQLSFCTGELAQAVWASFEECQGELARVSTVCHLVVRWWLRRGHNVYLKFVYRLLPMLVCWELWKARNTGVFEGRRAVSTEVVRQVFIQLCALFHCRFPEIDGYFGSWDVFHSALVGMRRRVSIIQVAWVAPTGGYKLNSDGCSRGNPGISGGGCVVRDRDGKLIFGYSCFFGSLTSLHAELRAILFGVRLCVAQGLHGLHIESDSLSLVRILQ